MKPVLVNAYDTTGGAARAAIRLYEGLCGMGLDCSYISRVKESDREDIIGADGRFSQRIAKVLYYLNYLPVGRVNFRSENPLFSVSFTPSRGPHRINQEDPDVINLHWIPNFINPEHLGQLNAPLVWTLHDMWAFTGGCHYAGDCTRYTDSCGQCPVLEHPSRIDLSSITWRRKRRAWRDLEMTIVSPSTWLAERARESTLFQDHTIEVIHNGIDLDVFTPYPRRGARDNLGLPEEPQLVLFGAVGSDPAHRKGVDLLIEALQKLVHRDVDFKILSIGNTDLDIKNVEMLNLGYVPDSDLPYVYAAADATVVPSRQENLSNMIVESLAAGTPGVVFNIGGMPDMITHKENGYLAQPYDTGDLADGVEWCLSTDQGELRHAARKTAETKFDIKQIANKYTNLFRAVK